MTATRPRPDVVAVVVPAHDEAGRIASCVASIARAARNPALHDVKVELTIVLDACTDTTGERATAAISRARAASGSFDGAVAEVSYANVGRTRAHGMAAALGGLAGVDAGKIWLASTDADTVVPEDWIVHQLHLRRMGYEAIAGTIRVESWAGQPASVPGLHNRHYRSRGGTRFGHRHVHGANLGFSAQAYRRAGGFLGVVTGEDHALWRDLRAVGTASISSPVAAVTTSSRRQGRAPDGFAGFLRNLTTPEVAREV